MVLYTCAVSRGIVLDVVKDQGAGAIMKSFCRFAPRRSCPDKIMSDHGFEFYGKENAKFRGKVWVN